MPSSAPSRSRGRLRDGCPPLRAPSCSASSTAGAIAPIRRTTRSWMPARRTTTGWSPTCPQGLIDASETFVGLPKGQMGNSEVGHMNLGAGRVAVPDLPRIDNAIEDGSLAKNPILAETIATLKKSGAALHLLGLALAGRRARAPGPSGRSSPTWSRARACRSGSTPSSTGGTCRRAARSECLDHIEAGLKPGLPIRFATVSGRFYPMDRDKRWERVTLAYDAMVDAKGERATTPTEAVDKGLCRQPRRRVRAADGDRRLHRHEGRRRPPDVQLSAPTARARS